MRIDTFVNFAHYENRTVCYKGKGLLILLLGRAGRTPHYHSMKTTVALLMIAVSIADSAASQTFTNLNFERGQVFVNDPNFGFLDWNLAVPGWSHSSGNDTSSVYYRSAHLGLTQYYLLVDSFSFPSSLLAGRYSLAFASGHLTGDPASTWVQAYISETGSIPTDARSVRLSATGSFDVFVGGMSIPMQALGGSAYAGDISAFAGTTAELKIVNTSLTVQDPVVADNIAFSPLQAPEPSSTALFGASTIVSVLIWRRRVRPTLRCCEPCHHGPPHTSSKRGGIP